MPTSGCECMRLLQDKINNSFGSDPIKSVGICEHARRMDELRLVCVCILVRIASSCASHTERTDDETNLFWLCALASGKLDWQCVLFIRTK